MAWFARRLSIPVRVALVVSFVVVATGVGPRTAAAPAKGTEILWDTYGVPHIFAPDHASLFYAYGYAQMEGHADLLVRLYAQARGRGAEFYGDAYLASDRWVRTTGIPQRAKQWEAQQSAEFGALIRAFADGLNAWAAKNPQHLSAAARRVLPLTAEDVYAHGLRIIHYDWLTSEQNVYRKARQEVIDTHGSNGWAIGPSKSATGNAMLMSNSHLPWSDMDTYFEVQLSAPGVTSYGAVWVGFPVLRQCFTEYVAWTQTTNGPTGADVYRLSLSTGGYLLDGQTRAFDIEQQVIKVRQPDGSLRDVPHTIRRSVHGPVFSDRRAVTVALRVVAVDRPKMFEQFWRMGLARNFDEWRGAMRMQQLPIFHTMYADRDGRIMYVYNAAPPVRKHGNHAYWNGVIPGDRSELIAGDRDRAVRSIAAGHRSTERLGAEQQRLAVDVDISRAHRHREVRALHRTAAEPHAALAAWHPAALRVRQNHTRATEGDEAVDAERARGSLRRRSRRRRATARRIEGEGSRGDPRQVGSPRQQHQRRCVPVPALHPGRRQRLPEHRRLCGAARPATAVDDAEGICGSREGGGAARPRSPPPRRRVRHDARDLG